LVKRLDGLNYNFPGTPRETKEEEEKEEEET
jgi:hypothetical protein